MDISSPNLNRNIRFTDGHWFVERMQDFDPMIKVVKQKRELAADKLSKGDSSWLDGNPFILPHCLNELLEAHGIHWQRSDEDYNYTHDFLKEHFPCFLVHPTKNFKVGNGKNATPTTPIVLQRCNM